MGAHVVAVNFKAQRGRGISQGFGLIHNGRGRQAGQQCSQGESK